MASSDASGDGDAFATQTLRGAETDAGAAPPADPTAPAAPPERPGRIGRFIILRELGAGGMGAVYAAYDPDLDRKVAIKLLLGDAAGPGTRARMMREAQAMARVASPHVVQVYDVGTTGERVYIAMELLGGTLRRWLVERRRSWREVVRVFAAAGRGLAAAHARGLIHRDFKPDNVLLDGDRVCVADFGVAAAARDVAPRTSVVELGRAPVELHQQLTAAGALVGTLAYMSPEQLAGEPADARSDQYSFCVALHEALYGERPLAASTAAALAAVIARTRVRPPPGPPGGVRTVIARGLAAVPGERFESMAEVIARLEAALGRRRKVAVGGVVTAGVAAIASIAVVGWSATSAPDPCAGAAAPPPVELDADALRAAFAAGRPALTSSADHVVSRLASWRSEAGALRERACRANRVDGTESAELFDLRMTCVDRAVRDVAVLVGALRSPTPSLVDGAYEAIDRATDLSRCAGPRAALAGLGPEPAAAAALRQRLSVARTLRAAGRFVDANAAATAVAREAEGAAAHGVAAEAWQLAGLAHLDVAARHDASDEIRRGIVATERTGDDHLRELLYLDLARIHDEDRDASDLENVVAEAVALVDREGDRAMRWRVLVGRARVAQAAGRAQEGLDLVDAAIAAHREVDPAEDLDDIELALRRFSALQDVGRSADALGAAQGAVALGERLLGPAHPSLVQALETLSYIKLVRLDAAGGMQVARRAYDLATASGSTTSLESSARYLGRALEDSGRRLDAEELYAHVLALDDGRAQSSYTAATLRRRRANNLARLGRTHDALTEIARALPALRKESRGYTLGGALQTYGELEEELGDNDGALVAYAESAQIFEAKADRTTAVGVEIELSHVHRELHRIDDAIADAERAVADAGGDEVSIISSSMALADLLVTAKRDPARARALLESARALAAESQHAEIPAQIASLLAQLDGAK